uniref:Uncharacterized protein n=1 Tax=Rhizophora mucronata TaxID=61149 RepID=A0A2P2PTG5_RHIMU
MLYVLKKSKPSTTDHKFHNLSHCYCHK